VTTHLLPDVIPMLDASRDVRLAQSQRDCWIGYPAANTAIEAMDRLVSLPKVLRMPSLLLVGQSNNGKSAILARFAKRHELRTDEQFGLPVLPVLRVTMPSSPSEGAFWSELLANLGLAFRERDAAEHKRRQVEKALMNFAVRVIAIDELHHVANAGKDAAKILGALKNLTTNLRISLVAAGTPAALNALNSDPQLLSRFAPHVLGRWPLDREYLRFLASYEQTMPLPMPSQLASAAMAPIIYGRSGDAIGGTVTLLRAAALRAIAVGSPCVTAAIIEETAIVNPASVWETARRTL
jgi:Bacterial TniB protein